MKLKEHIRKVLKEEINESTFFRRRVDMDLFEKEFYENLNYAIGITLSLRDQGKPTTFSKFKRRVIDYLMDNYHGELSNWGSEEYPYDEVYNFLSDYFHNKIKEKYDEVFGEDINESIKRPLNETKNKFNRENSQKGEYSDLLETLTTNFLGKENVCDVFAMYTEGMYCVLVYYNGNAGFYLNEELDDFLIKYIPIDLFSHIINSKCD